MAQMPVLDADLHAYVDGEADAALREHVQHYLSTNSEAAGRVGAWSMQADALRDAFPLPVSVRQPMSVAKTREPSLRRQSAYALALFAAFCAGVAAAVMFFIVAFAKTSL